MDERDPHRRQSAAPSRAAASATSRGASARASRAGSARNPRGRGARGPARQRALDAGDVLPLLHRLARQAPAGSDESLFAHRQLAELVAERNPWRAALYARRVLAHREGDDRAWAALALCQTMLGNYRYAVTAYRKALAAAPKNPWYAHNLGHLLDVALGKPEEALSWLRMAQGGASWSSEVAVSFAHALARAGKIGEAKRVLGRIMRKGPSRDTSREQSALLKWLEAGAPADKDWATPPGSPLTPSLRPLAAPARLPEPEGEGPARRRKAAASDGPPPSEGRGAKRTPRDALEDALLQGMARLPLDGPQRTRARALARDARVAFQSRRDDASVLAAAVAYGMVFVDQMPLTQAEVAASFRVSVARVRSCFAALRSHLGLTPGDVRYASR